MKKSVFNEIFFGVKNNFHNGNSERISMTFIFSDGSSCSFDFCKDFHDQNILAKTIKNKTGKSIKDIKEWKRHTHARAKKGLKPKDKHGCISQ